MTEFDYGDDVRGTALLFSLPLVPSPPTSPRLTIEKSLYPGSGLITNGSSSD